MKKLRIVEWSEIWKKLTWLWLKQSNQIWTNLNVKIMEFWWVVLWFSTFYYLANQNCQTFVNNAKNTRPWYDSKPVTTKSNVYIQKIRLQFSAVLVFRKSKSQKQTVFQRVLLILRKFEGTKLSFDPNFAESKNAWRSLQFPKNSIGRSKWKIRDSW